MNQITSIANHSEQVVFDALTPLEDLGYKIYHSVRFVDDIGHKRDYEADFLICGPQSFMVLEVKGGNIKWDYQRGYATSTNRNGQSFKIDPWKQGLENSYKIDEHLKTFLKIQHRHTTFGHTWAAIFPDGKITFKSPTSYSGHKEVTWDQRHLDQLPELCQSLLSKYAPVHDEIISPVEWDEFHYECYDKSFKWEPARILERKKQLGYAAEDLKLAQSIAPSLAASIPLERVLLEGGPGTGKTALLCQKALEVHASDPEVNILYVCYNQMLADEVDQFFQAHNVPVNVWEYARLCEFLCEEYGVDLEELSSSDHYYTQSLPKKTLDLLTEVDDLAKASHIFVDEAQDLVLPEYWQVIYELHQDPSEGFWWLAWDPKQTIFTAGLDLEECLANLEDSFPEGLLKWPLQLNLRNHPKINEELQNSGIWNDRSGLIHLKNGTTKNIQHMGSRYDINFIQGSMIEIINEARQLGIQDLRILSRHTLGKSPFQELSHTSIDGFDSICIENKQIPFCTVHKYKGCESDGIILTGFDQKLLKSGDHQESTLYYLGLSRARLKVWILA